MSKYQEQIKALLNDNECAIFIDTNILSQMYRLNDSARKDFYKWIDSCGNRFHVPIWVIHEYSNKVYSQKTKEYLTELDKVKTQAKEFNSICDFVKGYVGDSLLQGSMYQGKIDNLKDDVDTINNLLKKISNTINGNLKKQQQTVHEEIEHYLSKKALSSDIYSLVANLDESYRQRYENQVPPGYKDCSKEDNKMGDLIIWKEIITFCKEQNVKKAILLTRDKKLDIVYEPEVQIIDEGRPASETERIRIAKESLVYEFSLATKGDDFFVVDFKTFVRLFASEYRELAKSFQLATAEEEQETEDDSITDTETLQDITCSKENKKEASLDNCVESTDDIDNSSLYLGTALCDGQYDVVNSKGCMDAYIEQLKSYNWYIQNPAINSIIKLGKINVEDIDINRSSVFVLGRNILQSAEGSSGMAISFIEGFPNYIKNWEPVFKQALVDGILFEIYFNSKGEVRPMKFKATFFEEIMKNIKDLHLENPFVFINERLARVKSRFVPKVGTDTMYKFVFEIDSKGKTKSLSCNGSDISDTFQRLCGLEFSKQNQLKRSLMLYYGIESKYIKIEGVPADLSYVEYIEIPLELPF